jgi:hypothetical protein
MKGRLRMLHSLETHGGLMQESCGLVLERNGERNRKVKWRSETEK